MNNQGRVKKIKQIQGSVLVLIVPMMIVFFALSLLTIDLSHFFVIRNELQNAADAAALHGSNYLYPTAAGGGPNWALAQSEAINALSYNKVGGGTLTDATLEVGYWDLTGASSTLKSINITPSATDVPGIQVTISKSPGKNGGPISSFFGSVVGVPTINVSAKALAVMASPNTIPPNSLFPIAMAQSLYSSYWDSTLQQPKIDPVTGLPYAFHINEGPQGGWSTFTQQVNSTAEIISLIQSGNPTSLSVGQNVWMANGVKAAVYNNVPSNIDVIVAIVSDSVPGSWQPVTSFGALHIDFALGGSEKYIQVHFIENYKIPATILGGANYGVHVPARLVK